MRYILLIIAICISSVAYAVAPGIPNQFYGTVSFESGAESAGKSIIVYVDGTYAGSSIVGDGGVFGEYPYLLFATDPDNDRYGLDTNFEIGGEQANETSIFKNGSLTEIDLTVPKKESSASVIGGGFETLDNNTHKCAVDTNKDDYVDIVDFNYFLIQFGQEGANMVADFNHDGVVDFLDFNLLMLNWDTKVCE